MLTTLNFPGLTETKSIRSPLDLTILARQFTNVLFSTMTLVERSSFLGASTFILFSNTFTIKASYLSTAKDLKQIKIDIRPIRLKNFIGSILSN